MGSRRSKVQLITLCPSPGSTYLSSFYLLCMNWVKMPLWIGIRKEQDSEFLLHFNVTQDHRPCPLRLQGNNFAHHLILVTDGCASLSWAPLGCLKSDLYSCFTATSCFSDFSPCLGHLYFLVWRTKATKAKVKQIPGHLIPSYPQESCKRTK